jgi:hypothetical protein
MLGEIAEKLKGREMYEKCKEFDNDGIRTNRNVQAEMRPLQDDRSPAGE